MSSLSFLLSGAFGSNELVTVRDCGVYRRLVRKSAQSPCLVTGESESSEANSYGVHHLDRTFHTSSFFIIITFKGAVYRHLTIFCALLSTKARPLRSLVTI